MRALAPESNVPTGIHDGHHDPEGWRKSRRKRTPMNLPYVVFDTALCVLAVRSITLLGRGSPWSSAAWASTIGCAGAAALRYLSDGPQPVAMLISEIFFAPLTVAFIVGAVRDEPQAEPLLWPRRAGLTRAQKR